MYHSQNEPVTLIARTARRTDPGGERVTLPEGTTGFLTQALGGSFTILHTKAIVPHRGPRRRRARQNAAARTRSAGSATDTEIEGAVWQQMRTATTPRSPINIVELGSSTMQSRNRGSGGRVVKIKMTLTAPGCGMGDILAQDVREKVEQDSHCRAAPTSRSCSIPRGIAR